MNKFFVSYFTSLFIALASGLSTQQNDYFQARLSIESGLSSNFVAALMQDRQGFLWIGTSYGLNRYDGQSFSTFFYQPQDANSLVDSNAMALAQDQTDRIWVGSHSGGLSCLDPDSGRWRRYRHQPENPDSLACDMITQILCDHLGRIWVATWGGGLQLFNPANHGFCHFRVGHCDRQGLQSDYLTSLAEDQAGTLWIGTWNGLNRFDPQTGHWSHIKHDPASENSPSNDNIRRVIIDSRGSLWIGTWGGGLNCFDPSRNRWRRFRYDPQRPDTIRGNLIFALQTDQAGQIWVGTNARGVNRYDPAADRWSFYPDNYTKTYFTVETILFDHSGMMWLGTAGNGLLRYHQNWNHWHVFNNSLDDELLGKTTGTTVTCSLEDHRGNLWIATGGRGLLHFNRSRDQWARHLYPVQTNPRLSIVTALLEDRRHNLWAGVPRGLIRFGADQRSWEYIQIEGKPEGSPSALLEDRDGWLWVSSAADGLFRYHPKAKKWQHFPRATAGGEQIQNLFLDAGDRLWIATHMGIRTLQADRRSWNEYRHRPDRSDSLCSDVVNDIVQSDPNCFWIATRKGINRYRTDTGSWKRWSVDQGLPHNDVGCLRIDKKGRIWGGTSNHLFCLNPGNDQIEVFDKSDGLPGTVFYHANQTRQGDFIFCCDCGCVEFNPEEVTRKSLPPAIAVSSLQIPGRPRQLFVKPGLSLTLPYNRNAFSVDFAAFDYEWPDKNRFVHKLEGFDREWIDMATRNSASYTNLPPGRYTLRIKGANSDGVWSPVGASLSIRIIPPFWRTHWFYALALCTFAYLSYLSISLIKRHVLLLTQWKKKNHIGSYKIIRTLGVGGMATVYQACHLLRKRQIVAIKVLHEEQAPSPVQQKRFRQEASIIDQIDHPNIVKILERGSHGDTLYIVMEYLDGQTIAQRLRESGPFPVDAWLEIMKQLADVLHKLHSHGIIHRDLKPANVMLIDTPERINHVKILDFGLARLQYQTTITQADSVMGTIQYTAPEQLFQASFTTAGDIYSLGMIAYEMLIGAPPYNGTTLLETLHLILTQRPQEPGRLRPGLQPAIDQLIVRMLDNDPQVRPDALSVLNELRGIELVPAG